MKYFGTMLATVGLFVAGAGIDTARADGDGSSTTLYTSAINATGFHCNAVNVSRKSLSIAIWVIDAADGSVLSSVPRNPKTGPGSVASADKEGIPLPGTDAYCKVQVFGDPNDVRVVMKANLIRLFNSPDGSETNIPVFLSWALEGR
jgi:hypothetical protein